MKKISLCDKKQKLKRNQELAREHKYLKDKINILQKEVRKKSLIEEKV